jgi:putative inorganic carbon (hco3(-)) transporter
MYSDKIKSWYPTVMLVTVLVAVSILITYMMVNVGETIGPTIIVTLVGVSLISAVIADFRLGFYALFLMAVFMFYFDRMIGIKFPLGTVYDGLAAFAFAAVFINAKNKNNWTGFSNSITILFVIITIYQLLQVFNPSAVSKVAWLVAMRGNTSILLYVVCFQLFRSATDIKNFTTCWLLVSMMVALYGFSQEYLGLTDFEYHWVVDNPDRYKLYFIWGKMRKFSFLSDPSAYGLFVAMGALAFFVLAFGPFKPVQRILFAGCSFLSMIAMTFSGTRTAIAMVAAGIVFYIVLTLRSKGTLITMIAVAGIGAVLMFGPFYGGTMNRIRSTFNPSEDASMEVRDMKRVRLQQYVRSHPIGGGLYTTGQNGLRYSAGHPLAEGWDADSGYLLIGLELGYIGLFLFMIFFFLVMVKGINNYFAINDPLLKTFNLVYLIPVMALSVAHFTQDAMLTKPMNLIVIAGYAVLVKIQSFEKKLYSVDLV